MLKSIHFAPVQVRQEEDLGWETLLTLARALYYVGLPAHIIETKIYEAARRLEVKLEVLAVPTGLLLSFCPPYERPVTVLNRETPAAINLELLDEVVLIADDIGNADEPLDQVKKRLQSAINRPSRWNDTIVLLAFVLSSSAFAIFFRGGSTELAVAIGVGFLVGTISILLRRVQTSTRLFELTAALGAAFLTYGCELFIGGFEEWIPMAAGLIILLPGVALVDSVNELATGHLLAGGARMAGVAVAFLAITFGTVVGIALSEMVPEMQLINLETCSLPAWSPWAAVAMVGVGSMVRFRAPPSKLLVVILGSAVGFVASRIGREVFGDLPGAFLAALTLALLGNLYSYYCRHAAELFTIPGLAVLVPGSVGVRSMRSLLTNETTSGLAEAVQMMLVAMALVSGLLFGRSIWQALAKRNMANK